VDNGINTHIEPSCRVTDSRIIECHLGNLCFDVRLKNFIGIMKYKHPMTVTVTKPILVFRVLTMTLDFSRLASRTMNSNSCHDKTSKSL